MQELLSAIWARVKLWAVQPMVWAGEGGIIILDKKQERLVTAGPVTRLEGSCPAFSFSEQVS